MIRKLDLVCSDCNKEFIATKELFYKDDFKEKNFNNISLVCYECLTKWKEYWQIEKAFFWEEYEVLYVKIELLNGDVVEKIDCTPMDGVVIISQDIPVEAQQKLYDIYKVWYDEKMRDFLKSVSFKEEFMRTSFTCETYGGDEYVDIAFRFNRLGVLETEVDIPINIKEQIVSAWSRYELSNMPLENINNDEK